jgi:hypothetical protein
MQRRNLIALLFKGHPPSRRRVKKFTLPPIGVADTAGCSLKAEPRHGSQMRAGLSLYERAVRAAALTTGQRNGEHGERP